MSSVQATAAPLTRAQMDALVDGHYRAEEAGDLESIVAGFVPDAEHDVVGRPGEPLHGGEQIAQFYRALLSDLRIDRFEPVRRWYGTEHVAERRSCTPRRSDGRSGSTAAGGRCEPGSCTSSTSATA